MRLYLTIKLVASCFILYDGRNAWTLQKCVGGLPGGCPLGPRPIDQHIKGFKALGAEIDESSDTYEDRS